MLKKLLLLSLVFAVVFLFSFNYLRNRTRSQEHSESPLYRLSLEQTVNRLETGRRSTENNQSLTGKVTAIIEKEAYACGEGATTDGTCPPCY